MTAYYPLCLDLRGGRCVVVGGGAVAARKVGGLREAGAQVTVVAPTVLHDLEELRRTGTVAVLLRPYREGDLAGAMLAIAATDRPAINARVVAEARTRGILVNRVDAPEDGDFIVPAVVQRGSLQIAISTGGRSPSLARRVREDLERLLPPEYETLLPLLGELRAEFRQAGVEVAPERWQEAVDTSVLASLRAGDRDGAYARLRGALLSESASIPVLPGQA